MSKRQKPTTAKKLQNRPEGRAPPGACEAPGSSRGEDSTDVKTGTERPSHTDGPWVSTEGCRWPWGKGHRPAQRSSARTQHVLRRTQVGSIRLPEENAGEIQWPWVWQSFPKQRTKGTNCKRKKLEKLKFSTVKIFYPSHDDCY